LIVESYGEEQAAVIDVQDYRILRAVAAYHALPPHPAPIHDSSMEPAGLTEEEVETAVREAGGSPQARRNRVMQAYLDEHINLGRAAVLLGIPVFQLEDRFRRLNVPRRLGPETPAEAMEDEEATDWPGDRGRVPGRDRREHRGRADPGTGGAAVMVEQA